MTLEFLVSSFHADQANGSEKKNLYSFYPVFDSADLKFLKFSGLQPHHFLVGLTKNEGAPDQNFSLIQPNRYLVILIPRKV